MTDRPLPAWYDDAKLGVFIHWGAASVPAYAPVTFTGTRYSDPEWYRQLPYAEMYQFTAGIPGSPSANYHAEHFGDDPYDAFVPRFKELIERWDPASWADLFERAGARYIVLTTKIEDGFLLWPSARPNPNKEGWQSDRDVVGELAEAVRARGIRFGAYYCGMDWTFGMGIDDLPAGMVHPELNSGPLRDTDYASYAVAHWRELIERYRPSVAWNDYGYPTGADPTALLRLFRELVPDGVVNDRFDDMAATDDDDAPPSDFETWERAASYVDAPQDRKWEACRAIGSSFGYNAQETDGANYADATELIHEFIDIVARGGNMLLNIGPTSTGELPWLQVQRFLALGWWLRRYGDAIYGTRRWERPTGTASEGLDVRYTASEDAVHAIVLGSPKEAQVELDVRLADDAEAFLEDQPIPLPWRAVDGGIRVDLPEPPDEQPAIALRLSPRAAVRPT